MNQTSIYLDWNATTPPHPRVLEAMARAAEGAWGNPSSTHRIGRKARAGVEDAREKLAEICAVHARDVLFTSGGTEANNLALSGAPGLALSPLEHPSITRVAEQLEQRGVPVAWVSVPASGRVDPESYRQALERLPRGSVAALMAANHETGVLQPLEEVALIAHSLGATLHVDAVQALGKLPPESWRFADSLAVAAHKIRGPKGIGALAFRGAKAPKPVLVGGSQERGLRPGTVDPIAAAGFLAALEHSAQGPARYAELSALRDDFEREFAAVAAVNGAEVARLPHVANLSFFGLSGDELVAALDLLGVCVSSGSACSAGTTEPSAVISAMLGRERARAAVRVSLGEMTDNDDIRAAKQAFRRVLGLAVDNPSGDG
ncbi:MAG TPA: cysteine desulfurase family protein [Polyangiaceae bacterium]|jgi:cysteine desulfurase|nr:cysteine desulfurase family protein [Polyangiaceae bacterium]